jgi:hypothetical protein
MATLSHFGTDHLSELGERIRGRLEPSKGERPGRPSDPSWTVQRKLSMSNETLRTLEAVAESVSTEARRVSPMQIAALLIEDATQGLQSETNERG